MAKPDVTTRYLRDAEPIKSGHVLPPFGDIPPNRQPLYRLCWDVTCDAILMSDLDLSRMFENAAMKNACLFIDTSFVRHRELSESVWDSLLGKTVIVTDRILSEIRTWRTSPNSNPRNEYFVRQLLSDRASRHPSIEIIDVFSDPDLELGAKYYLTLLAARKHVHELVVHRLREDGHEPTQSEVDVAVHALVKDRGMQLANDGVKASQANNRNIHNDEDLVVRAVIHAINTGKETIILTADRGVHEQFYKMVYLLDTHYRSMLMADEFAVQPSNFPTYDATPEILQGFGISDAIQVHLPSGFAHRSLPETFEPVVLYSLRVARDKESSSAVRLSFCAECGMVDVIKIKGKTGGLNTTALDGKTFVFHVHPKVELRDIAIVGRETPFQFGDVQISCSDLNLALTRGELVGRREVLGGPTLSSELDSELLASAELAFFEADQRVAITDVPKKSETFTAIRFANAIRLVDSACIVAIDSSVVASSLPVDILDALQERTLSIHPLVAAHVSSVSARNLDGHIDVGMDYWDARLTASNEYTFATTYYRTLVASRRSFAVDMVRQMSRSGGKPSDSEIRTSILSLKDGCRRIRRAMFGWKRAAYQQCTIDDMCLVDSALSAIVTGSDLLFVTCRPSVFEQFVTLTAMLSMDYHAYSWAETLYQRGSRFAAPEPSVSLRQLGFDSTAINVSLRNQDNLHLPTSPLVLNLRCWLMFPGLDETVHVLPCSFSAERPMHELLKVKSKTRGKNSSRHGEYNVHFMHKSRTQQMLLIVKDRMIRTDAFLPDPVMRTIASPEMVSAKSVFDAHNAGDPLHLPWHNTRHVSSI